MPEHDPTATAQAPGTEGLVPNQEMSIEEVVRADYDDRLQAELPTGDATTEAAQPLPAGQGPLPGQPIPVPVPPIPPLPRRAVSGRYRSRTGGWELELRVDADRVRPMRRVSGDFFQISGATRSYFGSFVVHAPTINVSATLATIEGLGEYTWNAAAPRVRVTIPRVTIFQPPAPATLQFFTLTNSPGATYVCAFESPFFRTVVLETDRVSDVNTPVFATYNTGSLPAPPPARNLSVASAYAEAGIEVLISQGADVVDVGEAANQSWSDAELHASMERHFSLFRDQPQFRVWEVVAQLHDLGSGLLGIMFDQRGRHRQGCAVFHAGLGGVTAEQLRLQLYTYVHELGHCFNLLHSWQKSLASPPGVDRPLARSWMNYPWRFQGGPDAFWNVFAFQFDDGEIVHLRHAFLNNIIMGGANFTVGAGLGAPERFDLPLEDHSGLLLTLSAPDTFVLGEPVTIDLQLTSTDGRPKMVHPFLQPDVGLVSIGIQKPGGQVVAYEPLIAHCVAGQTTMLTPGDNSMSETVYIGYGADGLYFDQPGAYAVRAVYEALDGSRVVSNMLRLRVRTPTLTEEGRVADLLLGEEQGALFYLRGSDSDALKGGREALETVLNKYGDQPLAAYAKIVYGTNLARNFKQIVTAPESKVEVRRADTTEAEKLMGAVRSSGAGEGARMAATEPGGYRAMRLAEAHPRQMQRKEAATAAGAGAGARGRNRAERG